MACQSMLPRRWPVLVLIALVLGGCSARMAPAGVQLAVRRPPPLRVEVVAVSPGPRYVWVGGHHVWQNGDYVWIGGAWTLPPESGLRRWESGHWVETRGGWYWVEGRWR